MSLESISSEGKKSPRNYLRARTKYKLTYYGSQPLNKIYRKKTFLPSPYLNFDGITRIDIDPESLDKSLLEKFFDTLKPLGKKLGKVLRFIK